MDWSVFDFVLAAVLLLGCGSLVRLAVKNPGSAGYRVAAAAIGFVAIVLGEADDAPGLVGFGLLLIAGMIILTFRSMRLVR